MFSEWVENTVGKGEIARYEQFLLFPVFSRDMYCRHQGFFGKGLDYSAATYSWDTSWVFFPNYS